MDAEFAWPVVPLGRIATLVGGGTPSRTRPEYFEGKVPWLTGQDISEDEVALIAAGREQITEQAIADSATTPVAAGTVIVTTRVTVGKVAVTGCRLCFSQDVTALQLVKDLPLNPFFLAHFLRSQRDRLLLMNQGSAIQGITRTTLAAQLIPLPPLSEQRRIVEILQEAEAIRRLREDAEKKTKALIPAIFQEMFGAATTWKKPYKLADLVDFVGGGTPSRAVARFFEGSIPWATSKDIKSDYLDDAEEHITEEAIEQSATNLVPAGSILMVVKSKILMHSLPLCIITRPFCFGQDLKGLIPKGAVPSEFIVAALRAQKSEILKKARGVNTEGLTLDHLRTLPIPRVTPETIERFVSEVGELRKVAKESRTADVLSDDLSRSLSQSGFTGTLTAAWRAANSAMLTKEIDERDTALKAAGVRSMRSEPDVAPEKTTDQGLDGLSSRQQRLVGELRMRYAAETKDGKVWFTPRSLSLLLEAPWRGQEQAIAGDLLVLAARGIVIPFSREEEREDSGETVYGTAYRLPRGTKLVTQSGDELPADRIRESEVVRLVERLERERML